MLREEAYLLCALGQMGEVSMGQISRLLTELGISDSYDIRLRLASLKEGGMIQQAVNLSGIVYKMADLGFAKVSGDAELTAISAKIAPICAELKRTFKLEEDYLAQYTEQSSGIVPVFLSIRDKDKIVLKISIIVNSVDTAKKICGAWRKNSARAYDAIWQAIAEDEPDTGLWTGRPEEDKA